jgi:hypothetical protein
VLRLSQLGCFLKQSAVVAPVLFIVLMIRCMLLELEVDGCTRLAQITMIFSVNLVLVGLLIMVSFSVYRMLEPISQVQISLELMIGRMLLEFEVDGGSLLAQITMIISMSLVLVGLLIMVSFSVSSA